jgi:outer membrane lipoprotein-sorting protein
MAAMSRRPMFRWLVPLAVVCAIAVIAALTAVIRASVGGPLPARSATTLVADLATTDAAGISGTVAESADLGLPALPSGLGGDGSADWTQLISGSHTLRVWSAGPTMTRVALLGTLGESDIIRNGADVWTWSSSDNTATHLRLPSIGASTPGQQTRGQQTPGIPSGLAPLLSKLLPTTPQQAAAEILAALSPTTSVRNAGKVTVAGRSAYELVIAPRDTASLVASIRLDIDGTEHVPLRLRVFAKGYTTPAFDIGFTQVSFDRPNPSVFQFAPPSGATVTQVPAPSLKRPPTTPVPSDASAPHVSVIGSGWTAILAVKSQPAGMPRRYGSISGDEPGQSEGASGSTLSAIIAQLPTVSGSWGTGRLLSTHLVSVLITNDGRVFAGAVAPSALYAAAASHK